MCSVYGCSNVPTRKVTVVSNTVVGGRTETIEVCEEHWSALNNTGVGYSMGAHMLSDDIENDDHSSSSSKA